MRGALKRKDIDEVAEIDLRFHGMIVALSSFSLLRHIWSSLDGLVRVRSYQALDRPSAAARYFIEHSIASHERLADVIRKGDPEAAAAAARDHILEVPERLRRDQAATASGGTRRSSRRKTAGRGSS
jgi:DNA-binding FadR family transcriptional regulator